MPIQYVTLSIAINITELSYFDFKVRYKCGYHAAKVGNSWESTKKNSKKV